MGKWFFYIFGQMWTIFLLQFLKIQQLFSWKTVTTSKSNCDIEIYNLYINLACLSVCLSVCWYPINVKTAESIGPKFFVGPHVTTGKVHKWSKFQIFVSIKIWFSLNFWNFENSWNFLLKSVNFIVLFYDVHKENMFTIKIEDGREEP